MTWIVNWGEQANALIGCLKTSASAILAPTDENGGCRDLAKVSRPHATHSKSTSSSF